MAYIFSFILVLAIMFEGDISADFTCYNDGEMSFCSNAVLDYSASGSYSSAIECAAACNPY